MDRLLEQLPEHLLDRIVRTVLTIHPSLKCALLSSSFAASASRVLFTSMEVEDDHRVFEYGRHSHFSVLSHLMGNLSRYAPVVKALTIRNPKSMSLEHDDHGKNLEYGSPRPLGIDCISPLLEACCNLEIFCWESSLRPPDGICEILCAHNTRLKQFRYAPCGSTSSSRRATLMKWDAPSLPLLSGLPITILSLTSLSQAGARALVHMLSNVGEESVLEDLDVDLVWLDESLCYALAEAGRRVRRLRISTSGTKLNDKGLTTIIESCDNMEKLVLDEVQGRISRSMWTKPTVFPSALRCLRIYISESGPHHSWAADHLDSLHAIPMEQLNELCISRREDLPSIQNDTAVFEGRVDDAVSLKSIPPLLVERLRHCNLTKLHCDFWAIPIADVVKCLENCSRLESLKICLDAPFAKLLSLTSAFTSLSNLHTISVSVNPIHAPGSPLPTVLPNAPLSLPAACGATAVKAKPVLPQLLDFDQMQTQTCLAKDLSDVSMPQLRDVKRFVRKCPRLELLEWYGRHGRGSWLVKRPTTGSRISLNVSVDYLPPRLPLETWQELSREAEVQTLLDRSSAWLDEVRPGQDWNGEQAELWASQAAAEEKDAEAEKNARRAALKKNRVASISTSSSSNSDMASPTTPSKILTSPVEVYSPTSPCAETIVSSRHSKTESNPELQFQNHKRSPSEPILLSRSGASTSPVANGSMELSGVKSARGGRGRGVRKGSLDGDHGGRMSSRGKNHPRAGRGRGGKAKDRD